MMRKTLIIIAILACTVAGAHEFWLEPQRFYLKKGEAVYLGFRVGENFEGENWKGKASSVDKLKLYYADIEDDLESLITEESQGDSLSLQFYDEGTALVAFQSTNKHIELEAEAFTSYLKEDGLNDAIVYRETHNEKDSAGRENYMRCAKTLFQIGAKKDEVHKKYCGLPLEFVPVQHPYLLRKDQPLSFRLLYKGKPIAGKLVKVWQRYKGKTLKTECITNQEGLVEFPVNFLGKFLVSAVHIERVDNEPNAQWQSFWASFTWGY